MSVFFRIDATSCSKCSSTNCRADRLTAMLRGGKPRLCQARLCRQAVLSTHLPIDTIHPGLLRDRDESHQRNRTQVRMLPAQQGPILVMRPLPISLLV
jgi:hypothetical protein